MKQSDPASTQLPLVLKTQAASKQALLIVPKNDTCFTLLFFASFF